MGVLDDAIRSHLELKRQHGASEDEVSKQEQDALGPARGQRAETPAEGTLESVAQDEELPAVPVDRTFEPASGDSSAKIAREPEPANEVTPEPEVAEPPAPTAEPEPEEPDFEWESEPEPQTAGGDTPPRGFERVEDAPSPAEDAGEEDVLEETPEFLQETPEHDRLWFEQKPPRDFDFDE